MDEATRQCQASCLEGRNHRVRRRRDRLHRPQFLRYGAALDVTSPVGIPEHFTLIIQADGAHLACTVVWRKEKRIGVRFG